MKKILSIFILIFFSLSGIGLASDLMKVSRGDSFNYNPTTGNYEPVIPGAGLSIPGSVSVASASIQSVTDSTTAVQVFDADGGDPVFNIDTTNERVGIGTNAPTNNLTINGILDFKDGTGMIFNTYGIRLSGDSTRPIQIINSALLLGLDQSDNTARATGSLLMTGNLGLGTQTFGTALAGGMAIKIGTAPTAGVADVVQLWVADSGGDGTAELFIRDEAGNVGKVQKSKFNTVEKTTDAELSADECSGTLITNRGWTGAADMTLTLPDADTVVGAGLKFKFMTVVTDASEDIYIDTEGSTTNIYLNGTPVGDGVRIWLDNPTIGEGFVAHTATLDGTTYDWFIDTINGDWADKGS